jgi:FMN phosphatase YigB (HAD superfamily)
MIRAVTFDADGTLWDFEPAMRAARAADLTVGDPVAATRTS